MLAEFLDSNRTELIERCREMVAARSLLGLAPNELDYGITVFLDQVIATLRLEEAPEFNDGVDMSGPASGRPAGYPMGETAAHHGRELLRQGFTVDQVVHDYGDLCQAITALAFEKNENIEAGEFKTLNRCLDNAIATAVTEFGYHRDNDIAGQHQNELNERLGSLAHELRNQLSVATLALEVIKRGKVGHSGATGAVLDRSLVAMRTLIDHSLADARMSALSLQRTVFSLSSFIAEVKLTASLEADIRGCVFIVTTVQPSLALAGDRDLLLAAVGNLLQNAFKFSHAGGEVTLNAYAISERIHIDVEDSCGGLPPGDAERLFHPFTQAGENRTGVGLGLSIARRSVEANDGMLTVRNIAGSGCVFTINLPRHLQPGAPAAPDLTRKDVLEMRSEPDGSSTAA